MIQQFTLGKAERLKSRKLIEQYYSMDREKLAAAMEITVNTLRNRALRIRERLYACVMRRRDES